MLPKTLKHLRGVAEGARADLDQHVERITQTVEDSSLIVLTVLTAVLFLSSAALLLSLRRDNG